MVRLTPIDKQRSVTPSLGLEPETAVLRSKRNPSSAMGAPGLGADTFQPRFKGLNTLDDAVGDVVLGYHRPEPDLDQLNDAFVQVRQAAEKPRDGLPHGYLQPDNVAFLVTNPKRLTYLLGHGMFDHTYHHWKFGESTDRQWATRNAGYSRIYEVMRLGNPVIAFFDATNDFPSNRVVIPHALAHSDFFNQNIYFRHNDRDMNRRMGQIANEIDAIQNSPTVLAERSEPDVDPVEKFIEQVYSLESLIDWNHRFDLSRMPPMVYRKEDIRTEDLDQLHALEPTGDRDLARIYGEYERLKDRRTALMKDRIEQSKKFPFQPTRDVMGIIAQHSHVLRPWQRDIMKNIRETTYYYGPTGRTKIANEGWATFWHLFFTFECPETIDRKVLSQSAGLANGVLNQVSPYSIGYYTWESIYQRAGRGLLNKSDRDFKTHDDWVRATRAPHNHTAAVQAMHQIRQTHDDQLLLERYFDERAHQNLLRILRDAYPEAELERRDLVSFKGFKKSLMEKTQNMGAPLIEVDDANFNNYGYLHLNHVPTNNRILDPEYLHKTLPVITQLWGRSVVLDTTVPTDKPNERKPVRYTCHYNTDPSKMKVESSLDKEKKAK